MCPFPRNGLKSAQSPLHVQLGVQYTVHPVYLLLPLSFPASIRRRAAQEPSNCREVPTSRGEIRPFAFFFFHFWTDVLIFFPVMFIL